MSYLVALTLCIIVVIIVLTICLLVVIQYRQAAQLWLIKEVAKENEKSARKLRVVKD